MPLSGTIVTEQGHLPLKTGLEKERWNGTENGTFKQTV